MRATYLIGKHLPRHGTMALTDRCCMCGVEPDAAIKANPKDDIIKDSFMDNDYLLEGDQICEYCSACMGHNQERKYWVKQYSFMATERELRRLKREDIWPVLFAPPTEPFVLCVTYNNKKHTSFKSKVNFSNRRYFVQTENYSIWINLDDIGELSRAIQSWYTVCKDTKQEPTWFTKDEIKNGVDNFKKIETYGVNKFTRENKIIEPFRGMGVLELLCFALNKQGAVKTNDSTNLHI